MTSIRRVILRSFGTNFDALCPEQLWPHVNDDATVVLPRRPGLSNSNSSGDADPVTPNTTSDAEYERRCHQHMLAITRAPDPEDDTSDDDGDDDGERTESSHQPIESGNPIVPDTGWGLFPAGTSVRKR